MSLLSHVVLATALLSPDVVLAVLLAGSSWCAVIRSWSRSAAQLPH